MKRKKLKIAMLFSTPFPPEEGIGNYVLNLSKNLVENGHEVTIMTRGGLKFEISEYDELPVIKLPFIMAYPFHTDIHGIFVNKLLKEMNGCFDIIHVHTPLIPAVSARAPVVATFHTPLITDSRTVELIDAYSFFAKALGVLAYRIERALISSSQILSAVSESVASDLERYYRVESKDVVIFGNAVRDSFLSKGRNTRKKDENMILYVGRIDYRKGALDLVESMKTVTENSPKTRLVIIGKGPLLPSLVKRVATLGLRKNVIIKGFVGDEDLLDANSNASIFVQPSYYEGLPTTILEAMASQCAVIATSVHGNIDVVKDGETGILVPPRSPKSLGKAIIDLLERPDFRHEISRNARKLIENEYTWSKVTERVLDAYSTVSGD